ncbi:SDR family oxidoreductase [Paenibacillus beijingensis]|uniref:SDR family oxidoreductase n=1 Tax=Paenibacillus beijingensis TaxID=1126833 RepID=UPI000696C2DE|nr:SDR family NAD(P)-dependent oxidoreductase [Paenibacillus beijingensis]
MKTILVTGSSGDIASSLIDGLDGRIYKIIGLDIKPSKSQLHQFYQWYKCDLSSSDSITECLRHGIGARLEEIDTIVHLAGIYPNTPIEDYDCDLWDKVHDVNVKSLYLIVKYIVSRKTTQLKNIVIVSSTAAKTGSKDPAYSSSKAALIGLAKSLSVSLADRNIRVNTVLPGIIDTSMSQVQSKERKQFHKEKTLAKYIGKPHEVADVITFLLDDRSSYIWGASIDVNGGMTL